MEQIHGVDYQTFKETQYDILADALREHLDMRRFIKFWKKGHKDEDRTGAGKPARD